MAHHLLGKLPVRLWNAYNHQLRNHPIHTKSATSCVAFALGDVLAQHLTKQHHQERFDWSRTARMAAFGVFIAGPVGHHWYRFLDTNIHATNPTTPRAIATKVGLDQLVFAPVSTFMFYAYLVSAEGRPSAYVATIRDKYWATNVAGWKLCVGCWCCRLLGAFTPASTTGGQQRMSSTLPSCHPRSASCTPTSCRCVLASSERQCVVCTQVPMCAPPCPRALRHPPQILGTYILSRVANKRGQHAELTIDGAAITD